MGRWLAKARMSAPATAEKPSATTERGNAVTRKAPDPWESLLADAGPLRGTLEAFRAQGCALNVIAGRVFFGPYDDFEGCAWRDADAWHAAYAIALAPHELTLKDLLVRLLERVESSSAVDTVDTQEGRRARAG